MTTERLQSSRSLRPIELALILIALCVPLLVYLAASRSSSSTTPTPSAAPITIHGKVTPVFIESKNGRIKMPDSCPSANAQGAFKVGTSVEFKQDYGCTASCTVPRRESDAHNVSFSLQPPQQPSHTVWFTTLLDGGLMQHGELDPNGRELITDMWIGYDAENRNGVTIAFYFQKE